MGALTDAEPIFPPKKIVALTADVIGVPLLFGGKMGAGILHPGDQGIAILAVARVFLQIGIQHIRRTIPVAGFVVAVAQFKGVAESLHHCMEIAFLGFVGW